MLAVSYRHARPRFDEGREPLGEDFPLTVGIATVEFPHGEEKLDAAACTGHITHYSAIVAMDRRRPFRTQWTTRRGRCGNNSND